MQFEPNLEIIGDRIILRIIENPTFELATRLSKMAADNKDHLLPWLEWVENTSPEEFFKYMVLCEENRKKGIFWQYILFLKDETPIGSVTVCHKNTSCPHQVEFGFWQDKAHCGKGYVAEAIALMEKEFFRLGAGRLYIRNDIENIASANVAKRAGFHFEGVCLKERMNHYMKEHRDLKHWSKINPDFK